jgi:hypothetical protein
MPGKEGQYGHTNSEGRKCFRHGAERSIGFAGALAPTRRVFLFHQQLKSMRPRLGGPEKRTSATRYRDHGRHGAPAGPQPMQQAVKALEAESNE